MSLHSRLLITLAFLVCFSAFAHAQPARTFVASTGADANPCNLAAPCRTLQRGIDAVAAGGDVLIVDSGGFGSNVMIIKSVSVFAPPGNESRIAVANQQTGITVNGSGISVAINNLGITGTDGTGIYFQNGTALSLFRLDVNVGSGDLGVVHQAGGGHLTMLETLMRNANGGLFVANSFTPLRATVIRSRAENCVRCFIAGRNSAVAIQASSASGQHIICREGYR